MHRFLMEVALEPGALLALPTEEAKHALRVLRLEEGAEIVLLDGAGGVHQAVLEQVGRNEAWARVGEALPNGEPGARITLYQGLAKGEKMDWIVQKATELGVAALQPVRFSRCVAQGGRVERWQRIALEAAKQCGRGRVPRVEEPVEGADLPGIIAGHEQCLVPWEQARGVGLQEALNRGKGDIALVIGPEGGLESAEVEALCARGARAITLGPRILRTETAAIAAVALTLFAMGEL